MEKSQLKNRMAAIIAAILLCIAPVTAQSVKKHIVERGETLASIAEKYGISQDELARLNPDAAQFVYVGMELMLPESTQQATPNADNATVSVEPAEVAKGNAVVGYASNTNENTIVASGQEAHNVGDVTPTMEFAIKYVALSGDGAEIYKNSIIGGMGAAFGAKVFLNERVFVEGLLGYQWRWINIEKKYGDGNLVTHSIYLPIRIGVEINDFRIKAGPYFDYVVSGKQEIGSGTNKIKSKVKKDRFSAGASLVLGYKQFEISFGLGMTDFCGIKKCKETFFSIGFSI